MADHVKEAIRGLYAHPQLCEDIDEEERVSFL